MIQDEAAEADAIADLVNRLALLHGDPERFHLVKDEAAKRLRRMAKRLRGDAKRLRGDAKRLPGDDRRREPTTVWRPDARI